MTVSDFKLSTNNKVGKELINYVEYMIMGAATCFRMDNYVDAQIEGELLVLTQLDSHNNKVNYYIDISQIMIVKIRTIWQTPYENVMDKLLPPL